MPWGRVPPACKQREGGDTTYRLPLFFRGVWGLRGLSESQIINP